MISRIRQRSSRPPEASSSAAKFQRTVLAGIGDDCAVLRIPRGHDMLVTTDFSVEGVHFRREWHSPQFVGHRCLARGLSDIASMGGDPLATFLSLGLPRRLPQSWVDSFLDGFLTLARKFGVQLAGGDTSQSPQGVIADVVVTGSVPKGKAILRSNALPGDRVYVTGNLGASAAQLDLLYSHSKRNRGRVTSENILPVPRIKIGTVLRERRIASSMIDISDGLSTDLSHICEESGVGAEIWEAAIPRATFGLTHKPVDLRFALHGGDDYELLFTASTNISVPAVLNGTRITAVGAITRKPKMLILHEDGTRSKLDPKGWQHFQQPRSRK